MSIFKKVIDWLLEPTVESSFPDPTTVELYKAGQFLDDNERFEPAMPAVFKRGDIVFIQCRSHMSDEALDRMLDDLGQQALTAGITIMILPPSVEVVRVAQ